MNKTRLHSFEKIKRGLQEAIAYERGERMKRTSVCYPAIFHPCFTCGDTFEEACKMAFEAIGLALEEVME